MGIAAIGFQLDGGCRTNGTLAFLACQKARMGLEGVEYWESN